MTLIGSGPAEQITPQQAYDRGFAAGEKCRQQGDAREQAEERLRYYETNLLPEVQKDDRNILQGHAAGFWDAFNGKSRRRI